MESTAGSSPPPGRFALSKRAWLLIGVLVWSAAIVLAVMLLTGGGGDDGDPQTEDGLRSAARHAGDAAFSGDTEAAYKRYAKACRAQTSYGDFAATYAFGAAFFKGFMNQDIEDFEVTGVDVSDFDGTSGKVLVHAALRDDPELTLDGVDDTPEPWAYEDGRWVASDCSDMTFESGNDDS